MEQPITNTTPVEAPASEAEATTLVKFSKPYKFEGQTYSEIDLSGMDSLTAEAVSYTHLDVYKRQA